MGTLYVVATPIGNLSDFSPRGVETLKNCDLILVEDTRQTIKLLNHFGIKNKMVSYHKFNETKRTKEIIEDLLAGKNIALVSDAGTPCISDPGYILVKEARENGINIIGVSGPSAVITALSTSGIDTTNFSFYGFIPTDNKGKNALYDSLKTSDIATKVLYESPKRVLNSLKELKKEIPGCVVCVCSELTKVHESYIYGKIETVIDKISRESENIKGEYVIVINNERQLNENNENLSIEARLVDIMIKNNCTVKEAISILSSDKNVHKNDVYKASLNLKDVFNLG